jgi:uncharacterized OsmC-like protein
MATRMGNIVNGIDVNQLMQTINAIEDNPDLAQFRFKARNEWVEGGHSKTTIKEFHGAGEDGSSRGKAFELHGDEPPVLLGENKAPNAVEAALHALGSCLATGFAYNAAARGIDVEHLEFDIEGELDLRAFLGLSDKVRPGYKRIRVTYRVKANATREELEELCKYVQKTSPVMDIITNPVPVTVEMEKIL